MPSWLVTASKGPFRKCDKPEYWRLGMPLTGATYGNSLRKSVRRSVLLGRAASSDTTWPCLSTKR